MVLFRGAPQGPRLRRREVDAGAVYWPAVKKSGGFRFWANALLSWASFPSPNRV